MHNAHEHRALVVNAMNKAVEVFCCHSEGTFDEVMTNGIRPIADTMALDRVAVFRYKDAGKGMRMCMTYLWCRTKNYEGCADIMLSAARLLANACIREEMLQKTDEALKITTSILDSLDTMICVTVPETGEILFINDNMKQHYGIQATRGIHYKALQDGMDDRCEFCPCYHLNKDPNATVARVEHSTLTKHFYRKTDRYIRYGRPHRKPVDMELDRLRKYL